MKNVYVNNVFTEEIDGLSLNKLSEKTNKFDKNILSYEARKKIVNNILKTSFFVEYFSEFYDCHLTQDSALSSENNVCMLLTRLADYLLGSIESREMNKKEKTVYVFTDEYLEKKINRESVTVSNLSKKSNIIDMNNIAIVQRPKQRNQILISKQKVTSTDMNSDSSYLSTVLKDYDALLQTIDRRIRNKEGNRRRLTAQKHLVKGDLTDAKNMLKGVWGENINTHYPQPEKSFDLFDFRDTDTVKNLLFMNVDFYTNFSLWLTCVDFQLLLDKANLTFEENKARQLFFTGLSIIDVSEVANIDVRRLRRTIIPNIIKKVQLINMPYDSEDNTSLALKLAQKNKMIA